MVQYSNTALVVLITNTQAMMSSVFLQTRYALLGTMETIK